MDIFTSKAPKSMTLIRGLFGIICTLVLTCIILLIALKIFRTVDAKHGEIIAENAPMEYVAPFAAEVLEVRVSEGDLVQAGDTLVVLYSEKVQHDYEQTTKDFELTQENILIYESLLSNLQARVDYQKSRKNNARTELKTEAGSLDLEVAALAKQVQAARQNLNITEGRLKKELQLYKEGVISEAAYQQKHQIYLEQTAKYEELYKRYRQQRNSKNNFQSTENQRLNERALDVLTSEFNRITSRKNLQAERVNLVKLERQLAAQKADLRRLILVAESEGLVSQLFNLKQAMPRVGGGQSLLVVTPTDEANFYARFAVSQHDVKDVKPGQKTQIQLDAYHYYEFGKLEAEVLHVDRDTNSSFYILAYIPEQETTIQLKNGYHAEGQIVIGEERLWRYVFRTLFTKS